MHLLTRWRTALLAVLLATASLVAAPRAASADPPVCPFLWADQQAMVNEPAPACRDTWLVDPGRGKLLSRADLIRAKDLYGANGFSEQWLWYARETTATFPGPYPQDWTSCQVVAHVDGICPTPTHLTHNQLTANFTVKPVAMSVFEYNGNFISAVCGNFGFPAGGQSPPVPRITLHKFDDLNGDGVQNAGEPPLSGWTFQLIRQSSLFDDQNPGLAGTQTTDADGNLTFQLGADAGPGTYVVQEVLQDDWVQTTPVQPIVVPDGIGDDTVASLTVGNHFQAVAATGTSIAPTEGIPFTGAVGSFTDPDASAQPGDYAATVHWGDGASSGGVIDKAADGTFTVTGTHTYAEEGSATTTVTVTDVDNTANTATVTTSAAIGDAPVHAAGYPNLLSTNPVSNLPVATFTDENPGGTAEDFAATTVDWGDGTNGPGTVSGPTGGPFTVTGSHTYATLGPKTITVHVIDDGGATDTAVSQLIVFAYATGGDFVVGNNRTAVGAQVNFWGSQWAKNNPVVGTPPAAFKGFEDSPAIPACGGTWTSRPGNSSNPPNTIPTYMAVIVSTHVTQNGSTITGDVQQIVIVATGPGYAGNPGHDGVGVIVATLC